MACNLHNTNKSASYYTNTRVQLLSVASRLWCCNEITRWTVGREGCIAFHKRTAVPSYLRSAADLTVKHVFVSCASSPLLPTHFFRHVS